MNHRTRTNDMKLLQESLAKIPAKRTIFRLVRCVWLFLAVLTPAFSTALYNISLQAGANACASDHCIDNISDTGVVQQTGASVDFFSTVELFDEAMPPNLHT